MKLQKNRLLIANIVKGAVSGLRQLLATKSPWKLMKNAFYLILKALFVLKIFKFFYWLFGHVEKTVWLEREGWFQNICCHNLVNKQLQYTQYNIPNYNIAQLATCAQKPKVLGSSPATSYMQSWALCSYHPANV